MKYQNKSFSIYSNQSKKYSKGYDNINWNNTNKCKICNSQLTLLGLLENSKERWLCTKCYRLYHRKTK